MYVTLVPVISRDGEIGSSMPSDWKNGSGKIFQLNVESHALLLVPDIELHSAKFIFYFTVAIVHEMGRCQ